MPEKRPRRINFETLGDIRQVPTVGPDVDATAQSTCVRDLAADLTELRFHRGSGAGTDELAGWETAGSEQFRGGAAFDLGEVLWDGEPVEGGI